MKTIVSIHVGLIVVSSVAALATTLTSTSSTNDHAMFAGLMCWSQLVSLLLCASWTDLRSHRIPNQLTYTSIAGGLIFIALRIIDPSFHSTLVPPGDALLGGAICGLLMGSLWSMRAIGGGDVKLLIAIGLFLGCQSGLTVLLSAHLIAAVSVVARLIIQQLAPRPIVQLAACVPTIVQHPVQPDQPSTPARKRIPMGGFYALGVVAVCLFKLFVT